jgi:hypothetical protein
MPHEIKYWFPAKRYGWGWGLPIAWQGWAALLALFVLMIAGVIILINVLPPRPPPLPFIAYVVTLSILFACLCWWKGEPPRARTARDWPDASSPS